MSEITCGDSAQSERIEACLNFCQQFPTELLAARQLVKVDSMEQIVEPPMASDKHAIARGEKTLADIPGFDGCVAVKLLPVAKRESCPPSSE